MTWRRGVATAEQYADIGQYRLRALRDAVLLGGGLKLLLWPSMDPWHLLWLSPLAFAVFTLVGWLYKRLGWLQEASTVTVVEQMSWSAYVQTIWLYWLVTDARGSADAIPDAMPADLRRILEPKR